MALHKGGRPQQLIVHIDNVDIVSTMCLCVHIESYSGEKLDSTQGTWSAIVHGAHGLTELCGFFTSPTLKTSEHKQGSRHHLLADHCCITARPCQALQPTTMVWVSSDASGLAASSMQEFRFEVLNCTLQNPTLQAHVEQRTASTQ